jgi:hypothetical protein
MIVQKSPVMTPEQIKRQDLQVQWLISALAKQNERKAYKIDLKSLEIPFRQSRKA